MRKALCPLHDGAALFERAADLTGRAHRLRRKGELRRAANLYREACALDECDAPRWLWLGSTLARLGKRDEAERALKQALFLRLQDAEKEKANVIRGLLLHLGSVN
jgi:Flp pilus assembly protein TadD